MFGQKSKQQSTGSTSCC